MKWMMICVKLVRRVFSRTLAIGTLLLLTVVGVVLAALSFVWLTIPYATEHNDVVEGLTANSSAVFAVGTETNSDKFFFGLIEIDDAYQKFFLRKINLSNGSALNLLKADCREGFFNTTNFSHGKAITIGPDGRIYAVGHFRCNKVCWSLEGGNETCQSGEIHADGFLVAFDPNNLNPRWSESQQSDNEDKTEAVVANSNGIYIAGHFKGSHFKLRGTTYLSNRGNFDIFVARYGLNGLPTGHVVGIGGAADDGQPAITSDAYGNIYVTGYIRSSPAYVYKRNLSTGAVIILATLYKVSGGSDAFVVKLSPTLDFIWGKVFGGPYDDKGKGIAVYGSDVYVVGFFTGSLTLPGCCTISGAGNKDGFGVLMSTGGSFLGGVRIGSSGNDQALSVTVSPSTGRIFVSGFFSGTMQVGSYTLYTRGGRDAFIVEYDRNGNVYFAGSAGGSADEEALAVTSIWGNVIVGGYYKSNPMYVGNTPVNRPNSKADTWVIRLSNYYRVSPGSNDALVLSNPEIPYTISKDFISIEGRASNELITVKIYSMDGKLILSNSYNSTSQIKLDISSLKKGIYIVNVYSGDRRVINEKFVKE